MRVAVIDCGTNTFHLLIAEVTGSDFRFLLRKKRVVKLASNRVVPDKINDAAATKAIAVMRHYREIIDQYQINKILTAGTAAFRDAKNGKTLLQKIFAESGIKVNLITGQQEATLIAKGVQEAVELDRNNVLIMDIGGGSTEFIICNKKKVVWKKSFRLGAARLLQEFQPSDPFTRKEITAIHNFLTENLKSLTEAIQKHHPVKLIGASGSFDTFASMILHKNGTSNLLRGKTNYNFDINEYRQLHRALMSTTYTERLKMPGMLRMRADMIVMASLLLTFVLRQNNIRKFELSSYALKEGLLATSLK